MKQEKAAIPTTRMTSSFTFVEMQFELKAGKNLNPLNWLIFKAR